MIGLRTAVAACPDAATLSELNSAMERAERAYGNLDLDGFLTASDALRNDLPCLGEPMTRVVAARIHRVEGLRGFVDSDSRAASQSFAAARSQDPDYRFPDSLVPEGYPEWELYNALNLKLGATLKVDPMIDGYVLFDGKVGVDRPTDWATVVQVINEDGEINVTRYLRPGDPMPSYYPEATARAERAVTPSGDAFEEAAEEDPFADIIDEEDGRGTRAWQDLTDGEEEEEEPRVVGPASTGTRTVTGNTATGTRTATGNTSTGTRTSPRSTTLPRTSTRTDTSVDRTRLTPIEPKKKPIGLLTFSLASLAASGVSYGVAMSSASQYRDPATTFEELDTLRLQANLWSGVAAGTGLVALGTGIAVGVAW